MRGDCLYLFYCMLLIFSTVNKLFFFDGVFIFLLFFYSKIKHSENQRYNFSPSFTLLFLFLFYQFPKDKN